MDYDNIDMIWTMGCSQCGNDQPGFGWIAISWEIAIQYDNTTIKGFRVFNLVLYSLHWSSIQIRI